MRLERNHLRLRSSGEAVMGAAPRLHGEKELEYLLSATLVPREKFLQLDGMQHSGDEQHASRNKYFVRNADSASVVSACTAKLIKEPDNTAVLLIRASELLKTGAALTGLPQRVMRRTSTLPERPCVAVQASMQRLAPTSIWRLRGSQSSLLRTSRGALRWPTWNSWTRPSRHYPVRSTWSLGTFAHCTPGLPAGIARPTSRWQTVRACGCT